MISRLEEIGYPVVATVCDLSPTNVRLWNSLDMSMERCYFVNPCASDRKKKKFADAPHLIKLIRDNFLDSGFHFADGDVNSGCVRELIARSVHDLKTTHRLSHKHVNGSGVKRMNVRLAVELQSETTAKTLEYSGQKNLLASKDWKNASEFIGLRVVDSWFDLFNSRKRHDSKASRDAYGADLRKPNEILNQNDKHCDYNESFWLEGSVSVSERFDCLLQLFAKFI